MANFEEIHNNWLIVWYWVDDYNSDDRRVANFERIKEKRDLFPDVTDLEDVNLRVIVI